MSNTKKNAAANNAAAANNNNAVSVNKEYAKLSAVDVVKLSASWIEEYGTISAIRANYAALCDTYGKDNVKNVLSNCKTIRAAAIKDAADNLTKDVFTFHGISAAVFAAVAKSAGYTQLCAYARKEYAGNDAQRAAAIIRDFYTAVDHDGAPLCKVNYINAAGTEIVSVYEAKRLTFNNAVSILKTSLDGMKNAAVRCVSAAKDNAAAVRHNVRTCGVVVAVYAAAIDEDGRATNGARRDTSKDERTRKDAAAIMGKPMTAGHVAVSVWNAAAAGNEDAAAAVDAAKDAAKDAAARRSNK